MVFPHFIKASEFNDVKSYNCFVDVLIFSAAAFEMTRLPLLFVEQNSPFTVFLIFAPIVIVIAIIIVYIRIEIKFRTGKYNNRFNNS